MKALLVSVLTLLGFTLSAVVVFAGSVVYGIIGVLMMELTRTAPLFVKEFLQGWEGPVAVVAAMLGVLVGFGILLGRPEARWCMLGFSGTLLVIGTVALIRALADTAPVARAVWFWDVPAAALGAWWWVLFGSATARAQFSAPGMSALAGACAVAGSAAAIAVRCTEAIVLWWSAGLVGLLPH